MKGVNKLCSKICKFCSLKYLGINNARGTRSAFCSKYITCKNPKTVTFCYISNLEFLCIRFWHRTKQFIEICCSSNHNIYEAKSVQHQEPSPKMLM